MDRAAQPLLVVAVQQDELTVTNGIGVYAPPMQGDSPEAARWRAIDTINVDEIHFAEYPATLVIGDKRYTKAGICLSSGFSGGFMGSGSRTTYSVTVMVPARLFGKPQRMLFDAKDFRAFRHARRVFKLQGRIEIGGVLDAPGRLELLTRTAARYGIPVYDENGVPTPSARR